MGGEEELKHNTNSFRPSDGDIESGSKNSTPEEFELENDLFSCRCQLNSASDRSDEEQRASVEQEDSSLINSINMNLEDPEKLFQELERKNKISVNLQEEQQTAGLLSRDKFIQELRNEIYRSKRYQNSLALIILVVDNPEDGRSYSSQEIRKKKLSSLVEDVKDQIRREDVFGRWDRDDFIIMNPNTKLSLAIKLAKRLAENIGNHSSGEKAGFSCRFGVTATRPKEEYQELLNRLTKIISHLQNKKETNFYVAR